MRVRGLANRVLDMDTTTSETGRTARPLDLVRPLWSAATWRSLAHLVTGMMITIPCGLLLSCLVMLTVVGVPTFVIAIGAGACTVWLSGVLAALQRSRHAAFLGIDLPADPGERRFTLRPRVLFAILGAGRTWTRIAYHLIAVVTVPVSAAAALAAWAFGASLLAAPFYWADSDPDPATNPYLLAPFGLAMLIAAPWATRGLAAADGVLARVLLGPTRSDELERRVSALTASRDSTVDAADAERRRIERDLHDGAQQRITSLAMNLGIARSTMVDLPEPGRRALESAHQEAKLALVDLRDLVRGLHPAVLEDRGLDAALSAVAARSPLPVRVRVDMGDRVGADIEAVAYFVVSEALTNVARHAGAASAAVEVDRRGSTLHVRVGDDGRGGADPEAGTGLRGLADRVRSVDGTFALTSPDGGPTIIEVELPCERS